MRSFSSISNLVSPAVLKQLPFTPLIDRPTPVHDLAALGKALGHERLFVKREDATDAIHYGGNKVRNLEFLLGDALRRRATDLITVVPTGSNFTGALSAQAKRLGLGVRLTQFTPQRNPQINAHEAFARAHGAHITNIPTMAGASIAQAQSLGLRLQHAISSPSSSRRFYAIAPGGSSPLGALGHMHALLECMQQVHNGDIPQPDYLIVGAGTCGTTAGLMAGITALNLPITLVAIRAAAPIICHTHRILKLAQQTLALLQIKTPVRREQLLLVNPPQHRGYARPLHDAFAQETIAMTHDLTDLMLDSTYTTKVMTTLHHLTRSRYFPTNKNILYWHTFSPLAMRAPYFNAARAEPMSTNSPVFESNNSKEPRSCLHNLQPSTH